MTGFFGKLPSAGDFVSRGLGPGLRPVVDRWLSRHLAGASRDPDRWPEPGLRVALEGPEAPLLMVVLPSHDAPGRHYPLAAVTALGAATRTQADAWGDAAARCLWIAIDDRLSPDVLAEGLGRLDPLPDGPADLRLPTLWTDTRGPGAPDEMIAQLF